MRYRAMTLVLLGSLAVASCSGAGSTDLTRPESSESMPTSTTLRPTTSVQQTTAAVPVASPAKARTEHNLVFATRSTDGAELTLDLRLPADPVDAPIVIAPISAAVEALVEEGAIVVTFRHDDSFGEGPGGPVEILEDRAFLRGTAETFACAIRYARHQAAALGNDTPTLVVNGVSLGGGAAAHVALLGAALEARWDEFAAAGGPPRQFDCEVTDGSTHVDAVIGMAGTYDLYVPIFDGAFGQAYQLEHDPDLQAFLAGAFGSNRSLKLRLIHGTFDDIPLEATAEFAAMLTEAGYDVQLSEFAGGHVEPPRDLYLTTIRTVLVP